MQDSADRGIGPSFAKHSEDFGFTGHVHVECDATCGGARNQAATIEEDLESCPVRVGCSIIDETHGKEEGGIIALRSQCDIEDC